MSYVLDALRNSEGDVNDKTGFAQVSSFSSYTYAPHRPKNHGKWIWGLLASIVLGCVAGIAVNLIPASLAPQTPIQPIVQKPLPEPELLPAHFVLSNQFDKKQSGFFESKPLTPLPTKSEAKEEVGSLQEPQTTVEQEVTASTEVEEAPISAKLLEQVLEAANETDQDSTSELKVEENEVPHLSDLPYAIRQQVPNLSFSSHMFVTAENERWVTVNDKTLKQGQWITDRIKIQEIQPQHVILSLDNTYVFSLPALSKW